MVQPDRNLAPTWAGRAPSRRGWLQPFVEALPSGLLLLQQISSKIAHVGCSLRRPARDRRIGLGEPLASPCSTCFIRSRSGITKFPHRKSQTRSQLLMAATYHEIVAIAGLLRRNCQIVGSVRIGRHAVLDGGRRECTLFRLPAVSVMVVTRPIRSASRITKSLRDVKRQNAATELSRKTPARLGRRCSARLRRVSRSLQSLSAALDPYRLLGSIDVNGG